MNKVLAILTITVLLSPLLVFAHAQPAAHNHAIDCDDYCSRIASEPDLVHPDGQTCICNPLQASEFEDIIDNIIDFIFKIAIVLVPLIVVYGGFLYLTSAGNAEQADKGRKVIIWAAIGFGIILLSKGILTIINQILGIE